MPSPDQTDANRLPVPDNSSSGSTDGWLDSDRIGSIMRTRPDRITCRRLVDRSRVASVGSVGAVILITNLATQGRGVETNPITRTLIEFGWGITALISIGTTALVYELYARLAAGFQDSPAVPLVAAGAGGALAAFNIANLVNDLRVLYVVGLPETVITTPFLWLCAIVFGLIIADTVLSSRPTGRSRLSEWLGRSSGDSSRTRSGHDPTSD